MNFNNVNQIKSLLNQLDLNYSGFEEIYEENEKNIGVLFPFIKEPKKLIKFVNSNYIIYHIKIPTFIKKSDLYVIASLYKGLFYSNIILIHNNQILENDESSIDIISDGDRIIIIEDRIYPDYSYLFSIQKKYEKEKENKINIICKKNFITNFVFSSKTLVSEMINAICLFFGLDTRNLRILYNANIIKPQNKTIWNFFNGFNNVNLILYQKEDDRFFTECRFIGKLISAKLY